MLEAAVLLLLLAPLSQIAYYSFSSSPCLSGGIREGDVIVKLNEKPVRTTEDVHEALQSHRPLLLEIRRGNDDLLFNIHPQLLVH